MVEDGKDLVLVLLKGAFEPRAKGATWASRWPIKLFERSHLCGTGCEMKDLPRGLNVRNGERPG